MVKSIAQIFQEADVAIEKRANANAVVPSRKDDDIFKLAEAVRASAPQTEEPLPPLSDFTEEEKLAHALALTETVLSGKEILALQQLEKTAKERGVPDEEVQAFFDRAAAQHGIGLKTAGLVDTLRRAAGKAKEIARGVSEEGVSERASKFVGKARGARKGVEKAVHEAKTTSGGVANAAKTVADSLGSETARTVRAVREGVGGLHSAGKEVADAVRGLAGKAKDAAKPPAAAGGAALPSGFFRGVQKRWQEASPVFKATAGLAGATGVAGTGIAAGRAVGRPSKGGPEDNPYRGYPG